MTATLNGVPGFSTPPAQARPGAVGGHTGHRRAFLRYTERRGRRSQVTLVAGDRPSCFVSSNVGPDGSWEPFVLPVDPPRTPDRTRSEVPRWAESSSSNARSWRPR